MEGLGTYANYKKIKIVFIVEQKSIVLRDQYMLKTFGNVNLAG
jgi:hypothetical protein